MRTLVLSLAINWFIAGAVVAAEACKAPAACGDVQTCGGANHCGCCGSCCPCEKYCKVVCETKEVKKHVWVVRCSDFCAPLPNCGKEGCSACGDGCCGGDGVEPASCDGCGTKCDPCASEKNKCIVPPKCGKVREKKTLEKKEITCKVPSYKCVVVYCCSRCGAQECGGGDKAPANPASPPSAPGKTTQDAPLPPVVGASFVK